MSLDWRLDSPLVNSREREKLFVERFFLLAGSESEPLKIELLQADEKLRSDVRRSLFFAWLI